MRFRADLKDIQSLTGPLQALGSLSDVCALLINPSTIRLISNPDLTNTEGEQAYADVDTLSMFDNLKIESKHENTIMFVLHAGSLVRILKSSERHDMTSLKLSKKDRRSYLTIESKLGEQKTVNDLPIQLLSEKRLPDAEEPLLDAPQVKISMPNLHLLSHAVDKMKSISESLQLTASSDGVLKILVEQNLVEIESEFDGLKIAEAAPTPTPTIGGGAGMVNGNGVDGLQAASSQSNGVASSQSSVRPTVAVVRLSLKKFQNILQSKHLNAVFFIGCVIVGSAFVMHLRLRQKRGVVTFYIPVLTE